MKLINIALLLYFSNIEFGRAQSTQLEDPSTVDIPTTIEPQESLPLDEATTSTNLEND